LVLDEPTNDLDLPTLGVLENFLSEFSGCLLIVSHDRYFMDRLVDHLFVFEGDGVIRDFPGNYTQYRQSAVNNSQSGVGIQQQADVSLPKESSTTSNKKQLSYKEKREFEQLENEIEQLAKEKQKLNDDLTSGSLPYDQLTKASLRINEINELLDTKELRWLELSEWMG
jgi:ABC transport system ATP-binding/permease protein